MKPIQHAQIAAAESRAETLRDHSRRLIDRARTLYNLAGAARNNSPIPARLRWRRAWLPECLRARGADRASGM